MWSKVRNILLIILITTIFDGSYCLTKNFVSSWDFSNNKNWKDENTPCSNSEVSLDVWPGHSILINKNIQIDSLILGHDSEFIIADGKTLSFGDNGKSSCNEKQKKASFRNKAKGFWWDPESWNCKSADILECNQATPHVTRVPCDRDAVRLPDPNKSLYEVIISGPIPTVAYLRLKDGSSHMMFTHTSEFTAFAMTNHGQKIITKISQETSYIYIEVTPECPSVGCTCHSDSPKREVCKIMSKKCPKPKCKRPISINGFCCDICGSSLRLSHNGTLAKKVVSNLLRETVSRASGVDAHLASIDDGFYDAIFVPKISGSNYIEVSESFMKTFNAKLNKNDFHTSLLISSGESFSNKGKRWSTSNSYLIIIAIIFAIGVASVAVYVKKYRRNDIPNFDFRRFSLRGRRESTLSTVALSTSGGGQGVRFVNPIFDIPEAIREQESFEPPELSEAESPTQRSNPLFDVEAKGKVMSLSNLKEKLEPKIEEGYSKLKPSEEESDEIEKPSFEPIIPGLINPLFDDSRLVESGVAGESNLLTEYPSEESEISSEHNPIECGDTLVQSSSFDECDQSTLINPFAEDPKDSSDVIEPMEEKVEIEPLNASMLNPFREEEKSEEVPSQNELSKSDEDTE